MTALLHDHCPDRLLRRSLTIGTVKLGLVSVILVTGGLALAAEPSVGRAVLDSGLSERVPISRLCRHPSGDQRVALELPGTAWLQRDSGPRAVFYKMSMDLAEVDAILDQMLVDFVNLIEDGDPVTESAISMTEVAERCELGIFHHGESVVVPYSDLDTLSPSLARLDRVLDEIARRVLDNPAPTWSIEQLSLRSLLRRRSDGVLFEYYGETGDGLGAELHGVSQPLVVLETREDLPRLYDLVTGIDDG